MTDEERAVYSVVVNDYYLPAMEHIGWERKPESTFFLLEETRPIEYLRDLERLSPELGRVSPAIVTACRLAVGVVRLDRSLRTDIDYELLSVDQMKAKFDDPLNSWRRFRAQLPHSPGLLTLSRIGFDDDHSEALVYMTYACGNVCGEGLFVRLTRSEKGWKVAGSARLWIS
jgi:hypothetical protein